MSATTTPISATPREREHGLTDGQYGVHRQSTHHMPVDEVRPQPTPVEVDGIVGIGNDQTRDNTSQHRPSLTFPVGGVLKISSYRR